MASINGILMRRISALSLGDIAARMLAIQPKLKEKIVLVMSRASYDRMVAKHHGQAVGVLLFEMIAEKLDMSGRPANRLRYVEQKNRRTWTFEIVDDRRAA